MAHTPGPWKIIKPGHLHADSSPFLCVEIDEEEFYSTSELKPDDAQLIVHSANSYDRHCGANAVQMAEEDLLGQALEALKEVLHHACSPEEEEYAWKYYDARDKAREVLNKAKGA